MNRKLHDSMEYINDAFLEDAVTPQKRTYYPYISAIAAVLALVIAGTVFFGPLQGLFQPDTPTTAPILQNSTTSCFPTTKPTHSTSESTTDTTATAPTTVPVTSTPTSTKPSSTTRPSTTTPSYSTSPSQFPTTKPTYSTSVRPTYSTSVRPTSVGPTTVGPTTAAPRPSTTPTATTKPTTKPTATTKPTTKPTTQPTAASTTQTQTPTTLIRVRSGDESIIPIGKKWLQKHYNHSNGQWYTLSGSPLLFYDIPEYQIPILNLTAPLELELAENATAKGMEVQTEKDKSGTHIQFHQATDLDPGTYYIRIVVTVLGDWIGDQQESTTYLFGFKLIVPENAATRGPAA